MRRFRKMYFCLVFLGLPVLSACPGGHTEIVCGGGGSFICPAGFYCNLGAQCGGLDHEGSCAPLPHDCDTTSAPVCSCGGRNFQNACYANAAGDSVAYQGPCMNK